MTITPILQTPANEDKHVKRTREEGSSSGMDTTDDRFYISYRKRRKINPVTEKEDTIETVEIPDTNSIVGRSKVPTVSEETHQPSTSNIQLIEKQLSIEVSSSSKPVDKEKDIKEKYKKIKFRNETLKDETYAQYFKQTPINQNRLMSTFDIKTCKMQMTFMQPIVQQPRSSTGYMKINFEVLARHVHPIDQIEFHK